MKAASPQWNRPAIRLLEQLAAGPRRITPASRSDGDALKRADLAADENGKLAITDAGRSFLARRSRHRSHSQIDGFRAQHLSITDVPGVLSDSGTGALFDLAESPLLWLARRKGADGRALIEPHQLQAGERLRSDFTFAQMMPRTTANWHSPVAGRRHDGQSAGHATEKAIDARSRTRRALDEVGPEFAGLLLDVCCFLKRLEDVERERKWPARSAKVVLQIALEKLARHYGYQTKAQGKTNAALRVWLAEDAASAVTAG
jgi:hypothetical protein